MALKQVKNKILATNKTAKVTKAMEAVSAVKMRKSQEVALGTRPYVFAAMRILERVARSQDIKKHPLAQLRTDGKDIVIIVTSDKGLAGSVNSAVLRFVERLSDENSSIETVCIGRKAVEFARREKN